jgi:hypothetical protein
MKQEKLLLKSNKGGIMKHYFIDYENVHEGGLNGIDKIEPCSNVSILYSENCKAISLDIVEKATKNMIRIGAYKTVTGKNALDFQLSSLLGYVIGATGRDGDEFFIVSKDTGFDAVVDFWRQHEVQMSRICSLDGKIIAEPVKSPETPNKKETEVKTAKKKANPNIPQATKEELRKYLSEKEYSDEILRVVNSYKTRTAINNGFTQIFKSTSKAGAIYNKIKPLLKEKGKS